MPRKIILDTDIGDDIDDAIALSFAVRWPEVSLQAVTTSFLCTEARARMAQKQLRLLRAIEVPVAPGRPRPLKPVDAATEAEFRGRVPVESAFLKDDDDLPPFARADGVDLIADVILRHPGEVVLVAIGALTNVACLLAERPEAAEALAGIAIMGGELETERVEWNIRCDPEAARIVLAAPQMRSMGTYGVTRRVTMLEPEVAALRRSDDPALGGLVEQIDLWTPHRGGKPGPVVYDLSPILWAADPSFFTTRDCPVDVLLEGDARGRTVEAPQGAPIAVTTGMRHEDALRLLMETLLNR